MLPLASFHFFLIYFEEFIFRMSFGRLNGRARGKGAMKDAVLELLDAVVILVLQRFFFFILFLDPFSFLFNSIVGFVVIILLPLSYC